MDVRENVAAGERSNDGGHPVDCDTWAVLCVADPERAVEAAYRAHAGAVWQAACPLCGPDLAADVVQEVFLRLMRAPARFDPARASLRTYLLVLTRGVAIDLVRSDQRRQRRDVLAQAAMISPGAGEHGLLEPMLAEEARHRVTEALARLGGGPRAAIEATFFDELTFGESAVRSGVPAGTIKARVGSGLRQLRPLLADLADPDPPRDPCLPLDPGGGGRRSLPGERVDAPSASPRSRERRRERLATAMAGASAVTMAAGGFLGSSFAQAPAIERE